LNNLSIFQEKTDKATLTTVDKVFGGHSLTTFICGECKQVGIQPSDICFEILINLIFLIMDEYRVSASQ